LTEIRHIDPPPHTIIITAGRLDYVYQRIGSGDDVLGLLIEDLTLCSRSSRWLSNKQPNPHRPSRFCVPQNPRSGVRQHFMLYIPASTPTMES